MPRELIPIFQLIAVPLVLLGQGDVLLEEEAWLDALLGEGQAGEAEARLSGELDTRADAREPASEAFWQLDSSLGLGMGWKDNVLLNEEKEIDSFFGQVEGDLFAVGGGSEAGYEVLALLYGEYKYFEGIPNVEEESLSLAQASVAVPWGERWVATLFSEGIYSVQAFDASLNDFETDAATVRTWRPKYGTKVGRRLGKGAQVEGAIHRSFARYGRESENFGDVGLGLGYSGVFGASSRYQFGIDWYQEKYDARVERLSVGTLQEAPLLVVSGWKAEGYWARSFSMGMLKRVSNEVFYEEEADAVGDFYDRNRWRVSPRVELGFFGWKVDLKFSYEEVSYDARRRSRFSDVRRVDEAWRIAIEGSKDFGERFELFFRLEEVDRQSNAPGLSYSTKGGLFGIRLGGMGES